MAKKSGKVVEVTQGAKDVIVLSTGVVLKLSAVPAWKMNDVANELKKPEVPKTHLEVEDRDIENPDSPEYQKAIKEYEAKVAAKVNDYMIVFGTSFVSVPDGFSKPEDKEWRGKLEWSGTKVNEDGTSVYLAWVKYIAAPLVSDIQKILSEVGRRSGVSEIDVKTSTDNFRR